MTQILYPLHFILQTVKEKAVAVLSVQRSPTFERTLLFWRFLHFARLSFWFEQHVNENKYGALVERY